MNDSVFYTFSTVAQVVAGISAVVTALCTFRLQLLETELHQRVNQVNADETIDTMALTEKERIENHIVRRDLGFRLKRLKVVDPLGPAYTFLRLKWIIWATSYGRRLILFTLILSFATIIISVAILATVEYSFKSLVPNLFSSRTEMLNFGIALCAFALYFNALTLFRVFRNH